MSILTVCLGGCESMPFVWEQLVTFTVVMRVPKARLGRCQTRGYWRGMGYQMSRSCHLRHVASRRP